MNRVESFLKRITGLIGGGGDEPKKNVYDNQKDINKDNAWVQDFLTRHNLPNANNMVVGRDIGDAKPKFVYANGSIQPDKPILQTTLPNGVGVDKVYQTNEGRYGYNHPTEDYFVQVDPQAIFSKYGGSAFGQKVPKQ